jgi:hypothetical protein
MCWGNQLTSEGNNKQTEKQNTRLEIAKSPHEPQQSLT